MFSGFCLKDYARILRILWTVPLYLMVDSDYGDNVLHGYGQELAVVLIFIAFLYSYSKSNYRVRSIMLIGMAVGMAGELLFSLGLGMYHYRLDNVPLWLLFGHGLIFAAVYRISHSPAIWHHREHIQQGLVAFAMFYAFLWLILDNDWFGFLCTVVFLFILFYAKRSRLFFLIMFVEVCYIEQIGTATGCWYWPEMTLGLFSWLPSGNPPSGVAVFYFLFDAVVSFIYLNILNPKIKVRYQRMLLRKL